MTPATLIACPVCRYLKPPGGHCGCKLAMGAPAPLPAPEPSLYTQRWRKLLRERQQRVPEREKFWTAYLPQIRVLEGKILDEGTRMSRAERVGAERTLRQRDAEIRRLVRCLLHVALDLDEVANP